MTSSPWEAKLRRAGYGDDMVQLVRDALAEQKGELDAKAAVECFDHQALAVDAFKAELRKAVLKYKCGDHKKLLALLDVDNPS